MKRRSPNSLEYARAAFRDFDDRPQFFTQRSFWELVVSKVFPHPTQIREKLVIPKEVVSIIICDVSHHGFVLQMIVRHSDSHSPNFRRHLFDILSDGIVIHATPVFGVPNPFILTDQFVCKLLILRGTSWDIVCVDWSLTKYRLLNLPALTGLGFAWFRRNGERIPNPGKETFTVIPFGHMFPRPKRGRNSGMSSGPLAAITYERGREWPSPGHSA